MLGRPGVSAEELTQMGGEEFVNDGTGCSVEHPDAARVMTIDEPMASDPEPVEAGEFFAERLGVAQGQGGQRGPGPTPGFRGEGAEIVADLLPDDDLSLQSRRADNIGPCRPFPSSARP